MYSIVGLIRFAGVGEPEQALVMTASVSPRSDASNALRKFSFCDTSSPLVVKANVRLLGLY